jgi:hypothetical protein
MENREGSIAFQGRQTMYNHFQFAAGMAFPVVGNLVEANQPGQVDCFIEWTCEADGDESVLCVGQMPSLHSHVIQNGQYYRLLADGTRGAHMGSFTGVDLGRVEGTNGNPHTTGILFEHLTYTLTFVCSMISDFNILIISIDRSLGSGVGANGVAYNRWRMTDTHNGDTFTYEWTLDSFEAAG